MPHEDARPNVVLVVADDLGMGDVGIESGFGREEGLRALDEYSALRTTTVRVTAAKRGAPGPRPI